MKVPVSWLSEYCDPGLSSAQLRDVLAMSGTEVERVSRFGIPAENGNSGMFKVGRVLSVEKHPDADRLSVCRVWLSESDERTIVCGAPNVAVEQTVMVALPGAVLPDGTKLGRATLRGVASDGMILSETEIALGDDAGGIIELPGALEPGSEAASHVPLGDDVLEFEITPNRPDCLAVYGVARELHAATGSPLAAEPGDADAVAAGKGKADDLLTVTVADHSLCPRFSTRVFTDVEVGPSPLWLRQRLLAAGQRPISNVVDITNYVMLLIGQPMHAFDLDRVAEATLHVRAAKEGERLVTLDGETRLFDSDAVLVCDGDGPAGIGGIMGGATSEVSERTVRVAMEAATWNGTNILQTSKKLALRSEASNRFEKQLHPELALQAQRVAARLMVEVCGAKMVPGTIDVAGEIAPVPRITLRSQRVDGLLGERIEPEQSREILERLGFSVESTGADLVVVVPYFRAVDVTREADLIEEVARIHGLDKLPATLPSRRYAIGGLSSQQRLRRGAEDLLRGQGLCEVVSFSFIAPDAVDGLRLARDDQRRRVLHLANPLSEDQSAMRTTLLPGLLEVARRNLARDITSLRLFESGRVFLSNGPDKLPDERVALGALLAGDYLPRTWRSPARQPDLYSAKALLGALLEQLGVEWMLADGGPAFLHPGRAAQILAAGHECGYVGELHPLVGRAFGLAELERPPAVFELDLTEILETAVEATRYKDLITLPAVYQDIAVVVEEAVEAQTVIECVRSGGGPELRSVEVFDLYRGEQLEPGKKSVALRLEFRSAERTLTDEDAAALRERIKKELADELGAALREGPRG
ncbi:MAG: phenylalanine--tRNA ligase subunit beta [Solirubrobacterales bacterium]